jgi:hypothetical protein
MSGERSSLLVTTVPVFKQRVTIEYGPEIIGWRFEVRDRAGSVIVAPRDKIFATALEAHRAGREYEE